MLADVKPSIVSATRASQRQLFDRVSYLGWEIEMLKNYQDPYLPIPATSTWTTRRLVSELGQSMSQFYLDKLAPHIQELEREHQELIPLCNSLSPIHCLPDRILSTIFQHSASLYPLSVSSDQIECLQPPVPDAVLCISHVCRLWRTIAIDCAELWSTIDTSCPGLANAFLAKGEDTPLTVVYIRPSEELACNRAGEVLSTILGHHMHRVRYFIARDVLPEAQQSVLLNVGETPALKLLALPEWKGAAVNAFLQKDFPSLRDLQVQPCRYIPWTSLPLNPALTRLQLRNPGGSNRPGSSVFMAAMKGLPRLRFLSLCDMLPVFIWRALPSTPHISLPSLQHLDLVDNASRVSDFLDVTRFPNETEVYTHCTIDGQADSRKTVLARVIRSVYEPGGARRSTRVRVKLLRLCWRSLEVYYEPSYSKALDESIEPRPNLTIRDEDCLDIREALLTLKLYLTFFTLTQLVVDDIQGLPHQSLWHLFGQLPNVQTITLQQSSPVAFLSALDRTPAPVGHYRPSLYFPSLSTIELVDLEEGGCEVDARALTARLIQKLRRRSAMGKGVHELYIEHSPYFQKYDIDIIKVSIPSLNVVWDGFQHLPCFGPSSPSE
ncbi:hypothetical protein FA13DRAFT_1726255 [Coprinellus micaceus]|uniref:Uncharacterized protein n=1 Tax=Coprinellus micaceus TaxID=71717 RepID=A0A4Y7TSG2_COPMI|nr:hypothetical protein FA13DRAFT_1726255 [Coprinellus micaceus]